jgi:hypothetical protein
MFSRETGSQGGTDTDVGEGMDCGNWLVIMEAEKSSDTPSVSWRTRQADRVTRSKYEGLELEALMSIQRGRWMF